MNNDYASNMGSYSKALLFAFLNISIIHADNICPVSSCGSIRISIRHPFKLADVQIRTNNCTYFDLICSHSRTKIILNLPSLGDFDVKNIDYSRRLIQLYDPADCLPRRLMNFSLESSPFKANHYENFTFYVCPSDCLVFDSLVNRIGCLSNLMNVTVATNELSRELMEGYGCKIIGSWVIPISLPTHFDERFLFLTWDENVCEECEKIYTQESGKSEQKPMAKILAIVLSVPALIILGLSCCSVFCSHLLKMIGDKQEPNPLASPGTLSPPPTTVGSPMPRPSSTTNTGLDESMIMACTETSVLTENDEGTPSGNSNTCAICLENYCRNDTIRTIRECGHCFHGSCIQQWLGKNSTCPVCRTSLSDVAM